MMQIFLKIGLTLSVGTLMWSGLSTPAHAGQTEDNIQACRTAMATTMGFDTSISGETYYKLKKIHGRIVQKLTFRARTKTGFTKVICTVKRREVLALTDGDKLALKTFEPIETADKVGVNEGGISSEVMPDSTL